jgi:hypothetical protein
VGDQKGQEEVDGDAQMALEGVDGDAQMEGGVVDDEEDQAGSAGTLGVNIRCGVLHRIEIEKNDNLPRNLSCCLPHTGNVN